MGAKGEKKITTRERLLDSARGLFAREWYETVSVSRICKNAELSNGIFYRYFKQKEDIFRELLAVFLEQFRSDMEKLSGDTVSERLSSLLEIIIRIGREYKDLVTIFREGQYRFPEFEKELRDLYVDAVCRVYGRIISEAEYLFIISGIRFLSVRSIYNNLDVHLETAKKVIEQGFFRETLGPDDRIFPVEYMNAESPPPEDSRSRIIEAATDLFGHRGFYNVNVFEIAKAAGFSVGTFYIYFPGKEACLIEIVRMIGRNTRHFISLNLDKGLNRLETELQGMYLFLTYFAGNIHYYDIVREAEFVVNSTAVEYYDAFEEGYVRGLDHLTVEDKRTAANMLMGISHYLGIEIFFSGRISDWKQLIREIGGFLAFGIPE